MNRLHVLHIMKQNEFGTGSISEYYKYVHDLYTIFNSDL